MWNRIRQFCRAVVAKAPDEEEMMMLKSLLADSAINMFLQLTVADQRHSLNVLYTARKLYNEHEKGYQNMDYDLLQRCCILHDIGRGGDMTTMKKTLSVLLDKLCHEWAVQRGEERQAIFGEMLYRYYHHGEISYSMLKTISMENEAEIVKLHHRSQKELQEIAEAGSRWAVSQELKILMKADSLN